MNEDFWIVLADSPNHEELVTEIFYKHVQWAQIYNDKGKIFIQFYMPKNQNCWEFPLDEAIQALENAKESFLGLD